MKTESQSPTISVVIPAYNAEKTILDTIKSVQQQSFSDFEIIVINDGSSDRTLDLINAVDDSRIKVFSYENGGLSVARNRGITHAQGEFIAFLDADDLWTIDKLELQLKALQESPEAGVVYSWTLVIDESGQRLHPGVSVSFAGNVLRHLLIGNFIASGSNVMLCRKVVEQIGEFNPELRSCEDWDYWLRIAPYFLFVVVPKPQVLYRQSSSTMSSNVDRMEDYMLLVHEHAFQVAPKELQTLKHKSLAFIYRYLAKLYLTKTSDKQGVENSSRRLKRSIHLYPKILLEKDTLKVLFKILLMSIISPKFANFLFQRVSMMRSSSVHILNQ